jgi:hypothetical protein
MNKLPAIVLVLLALAISLPALPLLLAPGQFAAGLSAGPLGTDALNELRAVGGTRLAVALLLGYGAWSAKRRRPALAGGIVIFGTTLLGRVLSTVIDGVPGAMLKPEIAETVLVALAILAFRVTSSEQTGAAAIGSVAGPARG